MNVPIDTIKQLGTTSPALCSGTSSGTECRASSSRSYTQHLSMTDHYKSVRTNSSCRRFSASFHDIAIYENVQEAKVWVCVTHEILRHLAISSSAA